MTNARVVLERQLGELTTPTAPPSVTIRPLLLEDIPELSALMVAAYRGEVDDEGETEDDALTELSATFAGKYGEFLAQSSLGLWRAEGLVSAVVATVYHETPLFAFCMTTSAFKRRGYCRLLMRRSLKAMRDDGWERVHLYVTAANTPAVSLYRQLGFKRIEGDRDGA